MGVWSIHVCACEAQQDWINMMCAQCTARDKKQVQVVNISRCWCTWPRNYHIFTFLASTFGSALKKKLNKTKKKKTVAFLGDVNISNLKWRTLDGGGICYWPQWIRAVSFPLTWFIFPLDMVFNQCSQNNNVTKPTECDGTTWHETSTFSVSVSCFQLNNKFSPQIRFTPEGHRDIKIFYIPPLMKV